MSMAKMMSLVPLIPRLDAQYFPPNSPNASYYAPDFKLEVVEDEEGDCSVDQYPYFDEFQSTDPGNEGGSVKYVSDRLVDPNEFDETNTSCVKCELFEHEEENVGVDKNNSVDDGCHNINSFSAEAMDGSLHTDMSTISKWEPLNYSDVESTMEFEEQQEIDSNSLIYSYSYDEIRESPRKRGGETKKRRKVNKEATACRIGAGSQPSDFFSEVRYDHDAIKLKMLEIRLNRLESPDTACSGASGPDKACSVSATKQKINRTPISSDDDDVIIIEDPSKDETHKKVHRGWESDHMKMLVEQIIAKKHIATKKFRNAAVSAKTIEWDEINVPGRSNEECKQAFLTMANYIFKSLTLENILEMAKTKLEGKKVPLDMVPDAPKKPLTAYFLFSLKKHKSLTEKHPNMSLMDISRLSTEMWTNLSQAKKAKYINEYRENKAAYDKAVGKISVSTKQKMKDGHLTPIDLYSWSNKMPLLDCKRAYNALSVKETLKWIWKTIKECRMRKLACGENEVAPTLYLKDNEKKILHKSEGILERPMRTLIAYYRHVHGNHDTSKSGMPHQGFKALSDFKRDQLTKDYVAELDAFVDRLTSYVEKREGTLTEDEHQNYQVLLLTYQKIIRQMTINMKKFMKSKNKKFKSPVKVEATADESDDSNADKTVNDKVDEYLHSQSPPSSKGAAQAKKRKAPSPSPSDSDGEDDEVVIKKKKPEPSPPVSPKKKGDKNKSQLTQAPIMSESQPTVMPSFKTQKKGTKQLSLSQPQSPFKSSQSAVTSSQQQKNAKQLAGKEDSSSSSSSDDDYSSSGGESED